MAQQVEVVGAATWTGGGNVSLNSTTPFEIGNTFRQWASSTTVGPAPTVIGIGRWIDIEEVMEVYVSLLLSNSSNSSLPNSSNSSLRCLFRFPDEIVIVAEDLSKENAKTIGISASIRRALAWETVKSNASLSIKFQHLQDRVLTHQSEIDSTTHSKALERQEEILAGNWSWFVADDFEDEYITLLTEVMSELETTTTATTTSIEVSIESSAANPRGVLVCIYLIALVFQ